MPTTPCSDKNSFIEDKAIFRFSPAFLPVDGMERRFVVSRGGDDSWLVANRMGQSSGVFTSWKAASHFVLKLSFGHPEEAEWLDKLSSAEISAVLVA